MPGIYIPSNYKSSGSHLEEPAGRTKFTLQDAVNMMLPQSNSDVEHKDKDKETPIKESRLRIIGIGSVLYIVSCFPFYAG